MRTEVPSSNQKPVNYNSQKFSNFFSTVLSSWSYSWTDIPDELQKNSEDLRFDPYVTQMHKIITLKNLDFLHALNFKKGSWLWNEFSSLVILSQIENSFSHYLLVYKSISQFLYPKEMQVSYRSFQREELRNYIWSFLPVRVYFSQERKANKLKSQSLFK